MVVVVEVEVEEVVGRRAGARSLVKQDGGREG